MVALGERMTDTRQPVLQLSRSAPQPQLPFVHVWPDANEIGRVWCPDLGIAVQPARGDQGAAAARRAGGADKRRGWVDGLHAIHRKLLEPRSGTPTTDGVNFAAIVCEVDKHLADDATVTSDAGNFGRFIHRYIGFRPGQVFLSVGGRRDGLGHADGGGGGAAPAGHARWWRSSATAGR